MDSQRQKIHNIIVIVLHNFQSTNVLSYLHKLPLRLCVQHGQSMVYKAEVYKAQSVVIHL